MPYDPQVPYSTQSSAGKRTNNRSGAPQWTIYDNLTNRDTSVILPVASNTFKTVVINPMNYIPDGSTLNTGRRAAGIPVVTSVSGGNAFGGSTLTVTDVIPKSATDSGFYVDNETGERIFTDFTYVNKSVQINGTDGSPVYYPGYYVPIRTSTYAATQLEQGDPIDIPDTTNGFRWNLPPHKWSLPLFAAGMTDNERNTKQSLSLTEGASRPPSSDRYRRGRIWFRNTADTYTVNGNGKKIYNKSASDDAHKFGFQFLWNPESVSTAVAVQMEATPNQNDQWVGAAGLFPSTQQFSLSVRLDRTNDFARAGSKFIRPTYIDESKEPSRSDYIRKYALQDLISDYRIPSGFSSSTTESIMKEDLQDLFQRGTLADIEFLLRAINGTGPGGSEVWLNPRGIQTADIGFLQPTLLHIDVGPLSYIGWVTNLSVNHTAFTQDMIPIRTDLTMSFNTMATVGIGSDKADKQRLESGSPEYAAAVNDTGRIPTNSTSLVGGKKILPPELLGF
jgi:hypothetical protein